MKIKGQTKKKEKRRRRRRRRKKERKEENSFHVGRRVAVHSAGRQSMVCQELCVNDRTVERRNRLGCISLSIQYYTLHRHAQSVSVSLSLSVYSHSLVLPGYPVRLTGHTNPVTYSLSLARSLSTLRLRLPCVG